MSNIKSLGNLLFVICGLSVGNYVYQLFFGHPPDYSVALERSYFTSVGAIVMWVQIFVKKDINDNE